MIRQAPRSTRTDTLFPYTTLFDLTAGLLGSVLVNQFKTDYLNEALYTQATYKIVDQLSVTGGIRYTWDRTKGYGIKDRYAFALTVPLPVKQQVSRPEVKSEAPTGLIELRYKPRSEQSRVGKECVSTCRSRWRPYNKKKK